MTIRIAKRALLVSALVFCLMVFFGTVSAVTITESPDQIKPGDTVHLTLQDLHDGDTFSILIEGRFQVTPSKDFVFATDNFEMPISLQNGELTAYTENAQETTLLVKKGGTTASVGQDNPTGIFTHSESRDIASGTYDTMRLTGTVLPGKDSLVTRLQMSGSKSGPDNSEITFNVMGINSGSLYITGTGEWRTAVIQGDPHQQSRRDRGYAYAADGSTDRNGDGHSFPVRKYLHVG